MTDELDTLSDQDLLKLYKQVRTSTGAGGASQKLTEDQAKAQTYSRLMKNAEGSYQRATNEGYNPGSARNVFASTLEGLPFGGLDGAGAFVRDDVADRARQAEMQWSDAQLKAVSGAASPEAEVKRNVRTFFPQGGETVSDIGPQKSRARSTAFESAKIRSGPAGDPVGEYNEGAKPKDQNWWKTLPPAQLEGARRFRGAVGTPGTPKNPFVPGDEQEYSALPSGSYYVHYTGAVKRKP